MLAALAMWGLGRAGPVGAYWNTEVLRGSGLVDGLGRLSYMICVSLSGSVAGMMRCAKSTPSRYSRCPPGCKVILDSQPVVQPGIAVRRPHWISVERRRCRAESVASGARLAEMVLNHYEQQARRRAQDSQGFPVQQNERTLQAVGTILGQCFGESVKPQAPVGLLPLRGEGEVDQVGCRLAQFFVRGWQEEAGAAGALGDPWVATIWAAWRAVYGAPASL